MPASAAETSHFFLSFFYTAFQRSHSFTMPSCAAQTKQFSEKFKKDKYLEGKAQYKNELQSRKDSYEKAVKREEKVFLRWKKTKQEHFTIDCRITKLRTEKVSRQNKTVFGEIAGKTKTEAELVEKLALKEGTIDRICALVAFSLILLTSYFPLCPPEEIIKLVSDLQEASRRVDFHKTALDEVLPKNNLKDSDSLGNEIQGGTYFKKVMKVMKSFKWKNAGSGPALAVALGVSNANSGSQHFSFVSRPQYINQVPSYDSTEPSSDASSAGTTAVDLQQVSDFLKSADLPDRFLSPLEDEGIRSLSDLQQLAGMEDVKRDVSTSVFKGLDKVKFLNALAKLYNK